MNVYHKLIVGAIVLSVLAIGLYLFQNSRSSQPVSAPTVSQNGGGGTGAQPGGPAGGPGMSKDFEKNHQYTMQLLRLIDSISRLEGDTKNALTPKQAKEALAILTPLRDRSTLDEIAAKDGIKALQAVLTDAQRSAITALPAERTFRQNGTPPSGSPSGGPFGRPAGGPPGGPMPVGGQQPKDMNPLNPPKGGPGGPGGAPGNSGGQNGPNGGIDRLFDGLKAKGAKASFHYTPNHEMAC